MTKTVRMIPAKPVVSILGQRQTSKRKVAGYARVSTDKDEQQTSQEAQIDHYTNYIQTRDDWQFVDVYTDEGISATTTAKREGFKRMINDALGGKIDLIVTKSVSRFARNTVDSLQTIRKLKENGVEVYFEKENIWTFDGKGELLLTIMSSLAQEESRSISENVTWGQRKRFAAGKVSLPYKRFLGYEKGENGKPKIVESEAEVVRLIYGMFLQGKTFGNIAKHLTATKTPTPVGKIARWSATTIQSILRNEKYSGNALLQKKFTEDFLTKKQRVNNGEVPQYYVENSHPAIISPEVYDMVQAEISRRKGKQRGGLHPFSSRIICGECGSFYGSKVWHSTSKYRRVIWRCNHKYSNDEKCKTPHLSEDDLKAKFVEAFNQLYANHATLADDYNEIIAMLTDTTSLDAKIATLSEDCDVALEFIHQCVDSNTHTVQDQVGYAQRYNKLVAHYETLKSKLDAVQTEKQERNIKRLAIEQFAATLNEQNSAITEFDEPLWYATVESVTVSLDDVTFKFKDGTDY